VNSDVNSPRRPGANAQGTRSLLHAYLCLWAAICGHHGGVTPKPLTGVALAEFLAAKRIVNAHHEAGHAVAVVLRGGVVDHIALGDPTDDGLLDADRELIGRTRHTPARAEQSFVAFAGPWAQWRTPG
jgi:hypothetical protein